MRLQELLSSPVIRVGPHETANIAWSKMQRRRIRHLAVTDGGRVLGVVSERDLGGKAGASVRRGREVQELMSPRVVTVTPKTTLRRAANLMRSREIGCLPVMEGKELVGIVTATDVLTELGRGATRPTVRAQRQTLRLPANAKKRGGRPVVRPVARTAARVARKR